MLPIFKLPRLRSTEEPIIPSPSEGGDCGLRSPADRCVASFPRLPCFASGAPPHSRVVAAHGEQEAAEQPHVGVEPGGRHLPYMVHDAHGGGEAKRRRRRRRRQDSKMAPLRRVLAPRAAMTPAATPPRWGCLTHACQKKIQKTAAFSRGKSATAPRVYSPLLERIYIYTSVQSLSFL